MKLLVALENQLNYIHYMLARECIMCTKSTLHVMSIVLTTERERECGRHLAFTLNVSPLSFQMQPSLSVSFSHTSLLEVAAKPNQTNSAKTLHGH